VVNCYFERSTTKRPPNHRYFRRHYLVNVGIGTRTAELDSRTASAKHSRVKHHVDLDNDRIFVGDAFSVAFQRTLRVPDDGRTYPLPPGLGRLPVRLVDASERSSHRIVIIPLRRREAMWLGFDAARSRPHAVLVGLGGINAITGAHWSTQLSDQPQNYLVAPPQMWLDGFKVASDRIRQFVATPLGTGTTVESQLTGDDDGTLRLVVYEPQPGRFVETPAEAPAPGRRRAPKSKMGLGAGGQIRQRLYPDPHGLGIWDTQEATEVTIRLVTAQEFTAVTGEIPPPTPIDAATYTAHGFPWFEVYDEPSDLPPSREMTAIRSVDKLEGNPREASVNITGEQITTAVPRPDRKRRT
jgi:hypothetical protein